MLKKFLTVLFFFAVSMLNGGTLVIGDAGNFSAAGEKSCRSAESGSMGKALFAAFVAGESCSREKIGGC